MIGGMAKIDGQSVMIIGTQKGRTTKATPSFWYVQIQRAIEKLYVDEAGRKI